MSDAELDALFAFLKSLERGRPASDRCRERKTGESQHRSI